ncbi:MAG: zinc-ribbon domain containing protein [Patescibacteria group bacterium]|nr:zinc-ribbon domain containing protein [Patescibacteria group bacterium]
MSYQDKELVCKECGSAFTDSADDQSYRAEKGYTNDPSRCPSCRAAYKARTRGGGHSFGGPRQTFPAVCAQCGQETQVPFQPTGERPVYCRDCFQNRRG